MQRLKQTDTDLFEGDGLDLLAVLGVGYFDLFLGRVDLLNLALFDQLTELCHVYSLRRIGPAHYLPQQECDSS